MRPSAATIAIRGLVRALLISSFAAALPGSDTFFFFCKANFDFSVTVCCCSWLSVPP